MVAKCVKCSRPIQWIGKMSDMPPCRACGFRPSESSLREEDLLLEGKTRAAFALMPEDPDEED